MIFTEDDYAEMERADVFNSQFFENDNETGNYLIRNLIFFIGCVELVSYRVAQNVGCISWNIKLRLGWWNVKYSIVCLITN